DGFLDQRQRALDDLALEAPDCTRVPDLGPARGHRDVCRCEDFAAKNQGLGGQLVSHAVRPDPELTIGPHEAASTETEGQDVRHAEVGPDLSNLNGDGCLAWKTLLENADVTRCAAYVDNRAVEATRQEGRPAHRVRRSGSKCRNRIALGVVDAHQGAVVLAQVHRSLDADLTKGGVESLDDVDREVTEASVHDRRVLALQQTDAADLMRHAHHDARQLALE